MLKLYYTLKSTFDLEDYLKSPESCPIYLFLALFVKNLEIDTLTLKMTKIVEEMDYLSKLHCEYFLLFIFVKIVFLISELTFMTLNWN